MARKDFDDDTNYRGGRVDANGDKPRRLRYPCFATGCPMPGTIFVDQVMGEKSGGTCAWHYGVPSQDIPKVTQVFKDWAFLAYEVDECRRAHTASETACDPKALDALLGTAVERVRPLMKAGGWADEEFEPRGDHYREWGQRMERFLGARVVEVLSVNQRRIA